MWLSTSSLRRRYESTIFTYYDIIIYWWIYSEAIGIIYPWDLYPNHRMITAFLNSSTPLWTTQCGILRYVAGRSSFVNYRRRNNQMTATITRAFKYDWFILFLLSMSYQIDIGGAVWESEDSEQTIHQCWQAKASHWLVNLLVSAHLPITSLTGTFSGLGFLDTSLFIGCKW